MHELAAVETKAEAALAKTGEVGSPRVVGMHFIIRATSAFTAAISLKAHIWTTAQRRVPSVTSRR
jgi:hypothetical protein